MLINTKKDAVSQHIWDRDFNHDLKSVLQWSSYNLKQSSHKSLENKDREFVRLIHLGDAFIANINYDLRFKG